MALRLQTATLDNGLQVIAEVNDRAHTAAAGFFVRAGVRDETRDVMGVSHFLEHMVFKGTTHRTADEVNRDFDRIGANYNASTSQETTTYWAHVLPEYLSDALDLLTDILRPTLRQADFDMEKQVILEEIGMYEDRPFWAAYEEAMAAFYGDHPLGYRILGTNESINALSRDQMLAYFTKRYSPNNMVLALSGRVEWPRALEQITKRCGTWEASRVDRSHHGIEPQEAVKDLRRSQVNRHYTVALAPGPAVQDDARYAAAVLGTVLGDEDGSRLYWSLIDPGIADEAELAYHPGDGAGTFLAYASCAVDRAEKVETVLTETMDRAAAEVTAEEVERARNKIALSLVTQNERPAGRMMSLGGTWLYLQEHLPLAEELERITSVTVDDVRAVAERYAFRPRTLVRLSPNAD